MPKPLTQEEFVNKSNKIHNFKYNYSPVKYKNNKAKIKIICPSHGIFNQQPSHHLNGIGCAKCSAEELSLRYTLSGDEFIRRVKIKHKNVYDYSKTNYTLSSNKVIVICKIHGEFKITANSHMTGHGCKKCAKSIIIDKMTLTQKEFIEKANEKHNFKYDYSEAVYIKSSEKIIIKCKYNHRFYQNAGAHLRGNGCPYCSNTISSKEKEWLDGEERKNKLKIIRQYKIKTGKRKYIVDGFCKENNTVYEYFGSFFHGNPEYYKPNDMNTVSGKTFGVLYIETIKRIKCLKQKYNLISRWEPLQSVKKIKKVEEIEYYERDTNK